MFKATPNMGDKFDKWCIKYGRTRPPQDVINALNTSFDAGIEAVKGFAANQNMQSTNIYRDFVTFASGRGNR